MHKSLPFGGELVDLRKNAHSNSYAEVLQSHYEGSFRVHSVLQEPCKTL